MNSALESLTISSISFNDLPVEIISSIFHQCTPIFILPTVSLQTSFDPLTLGAVCSKWRIIAWRTPLLWSKIMVYVSPQRLTASIQRIEHQIALSGTLPPDIALSSPPNADFRSGPRTTTVIDALIPYAHRWRSLHINPSFVSLQGLHATHMPLLTEVLIFSRYNNRLPATLFSLAPALRTVTAHFAYVTRLDLSHVHDSLTSMTVYQCNEAIDCLGVLNTFPTLQHATFEDLRTTGYEVISGDPPMCPLTLPHLRSLTLSGDLGADHASSLLSSILTPELAHLAFIEDTWHTPSLSQFISQCSRLTSLRLQGGSNTSFTNLLVILRNCRTIMSLEIIQQPDLETQQSLTASSFFNDHFLDLLRLTTATSSERNEVLPELNTLKYRGPQAFTWAIFRAAWYERSESSTVDVPCSSTLQRWKRWDIELTHLVEPIPQDTMDELARLSVESGGRFRVRLPPHSS